MKNEVNINTVEINCTNCLKLYDKIYHLKECFNG